MPLQFAVTDGFVAQELPASSSYSDRHGVAKASNQNMKIHYSVNFNFYSSDSTNFPLQFDFGPIGYF